VPLNLTNMGDTLWLAAEDHVGGGYVSLGGHLHDAAGRPLHVGHFTQRLPSDVPPGGAVAVVATFGLPEAAGRFVLRLDMVDDRIAWFSQVGSPTTDLEMAVVWSDSRDPHRFEARIEPVGTFPPPAGNDAFALHLRLTNVGDTTWLNAPVDERGTVRVGLQCLRPDAGRSFAVDLVAEQICWFAHHGSRPLTFVLRA